MTKFFNESILTDERITDHALAVYMRVATAYHPGYIIHKNTFMNRSSFGREVFTRAWHLLIECGYITESKGHTKGRITYFYELVTPDHGEAAQATTDTQVPDSREIVTESKLQSTNNSILLDEKKNCERGKTTPKHGNHTFDNFVPSNILNLESYHGEVLEAIIKEELGDNYTEDEALKLLTIATDKYVARRKYVSRSHWCYFLKVVTQKASEWVKSKYKQEVKERREALKKATGEAHTEPKQATEKPKQTKSDSRNKFINFDQRTYDELELERLLLNTRPCL